VNEHGTLVAVRFLDKRLIKGRTEDFRPNRDFFHVLQPGARSLTRVPIEDLKAIFFIKTLGRDPSCIDRRSYEERGGSERKVWLEFSDGESLAGWSSSSRSRQRGFFVFPADRESNLEKAYVFRSALRRLEEGDAAEEASRAFHVSAGPVWSTRSSERDAVGTYRLVRRHRS
jgi:hypothetical protein